MIREATMTILNSPSPQTSGSAPGRGFLTAGDRELVLREVSEFTRTVLGALTIVGNGFILAPHTLDLYFPRSSKALALAPTAGEAAVGERARLQGIELRLLPLEAWLTSVSQVERELHRFLRRPAFCEEGEFSTLLEPARSR